MSDLRTRIAAALAVIACEDRCGAPHGHPGCRECVARMGPQADAVIRELGIRDEHLTEQLPPHTTIRRIASDWKPDE